MCALDGGRHELLCLHLSCRIAARLVGVPGLSSAVHTLQKAYQRQHRIHNSSVSSTRRYTFTPEHMHAHPSRHCRDRFK